MNGEVKFIPIGDTGILHGRVPIHVVRPEGSGWGWYEMNGVGLFQTYFGGGEFIDFYGPFKRKESRVS